MEHDKESADITPVQDWIHLQTTENDLNTHVYRLREMVDQFVQERDWERFHSPKNLSMSIAIEAAELMEHFQWIDTQPSRELTESQITAVGEELADVLCYGLALANQLKIDLTSTLLNKMQKNREKYPIEHFRGRFGHRDPNVAEGQPPDQNAPVTDTPAVDQPAVIPSPPQEQPWKC